MNKNKKSVVVFAIILAFFFNPLTCYIFYNDTSIYNSKILNVIFWGIPIGCVVLIFAIRRIPDKVVNYLFSCLFLGILIGLLIAINSLLGLSLKPKGNNDASYHQKEGLIFDPNSSARFKTEEFDYISNINSLGLRNAEINVTKDPNTYRILCFGDSFTFGWGVEIEDSWPMQLEKLLKTRGFKNVEVINCGEPGEYSHGYKKCMRKAIPLLKPDLVLVGMLQLDDLAQLYGTSFGKKQSRKDKLVTFFKSYIKLSFGNYFHLISKKSGVIPIKSNWEEESNRIINGFNKYQKLRFTTLSDTVQTLFKTGNLNAFLLNLYIDFPDRTMIFNNPNHPATKFAIKEMQKDIAEMKTICSENKAQMVFINLPTNYFTGHKVDRTPTDEILTPYYRSHNSIDSIYKSVAGSNNVPYMQLTNHFEELADKEGYFYKYDGHPNKHGYAEIAAYIGDELVNLNIIKKN
jgi:lysophospholipase L1-like esterase